MPQPSLLIFLLLLTGCLRPTSASAIKSPDGNSIGNLTENGVVQGVLVIPEKPTKAETFAAEVFQRSP